MRIGILGCGHRLQTVVRNLVKNRDDIEIAFVADPAPDLYSSFVQALATPETKVYGSADQVETAPSLDLVMIGSPNHLHLDHLKAATKFGTKIFCEKPAVLNRAQSLELAQMDVKGDFQHGIAFGFVLRFAPLVKHVLAQTSDQQIVAIEANEFLNPEHGSYIMRNWRRKQCFAGSFLLDKACHDLDILNLIARDRPSKVASFAANAVFTPGNRPPNTQSNYGLFPAGWSGTGDAFGTDKDIADSQVAILQYPTGAVATFSLNSHAAKRQRRLNIVCRDVLVRADFEANASSLHRNFTFDPPHEETFEGSFADHYGADEQMAKALLSWVDGENAIPQTAKQAIEAGLTTMMVDEAAQADATVDCAATWEALDRIYRA